MIIEPKSYLNDDIPKIIEQIKTDLTSLYHLDLMNFEHVEDIRDALKMTNDELSKIIYRLELHWFSLFKEKPCAFCGAEGNDNTNDKKR